MKRYITSVAADLMHLLAPSLCPACDAPIAATERGICEACRASLEAAPYPEEIFERLAATWDPDELSLDAVGSLYTFEQEGPTQRIIHAIKYRGCRHLGRIMGEELGRTMAIFPEFRAFDIVVPVPLHAARMRERGFNQAAEIARGVAVAHKAELRERILKRQGHTASQTRLSAERRRTNVADAFVTDGTDLHGARVLLCDDVCTTGATLNACGLKLLVAGAASVSAVTLAMDERDRSTPTFTFDIFQ